jgi:hypothetical protein
MSSPMDHTLATPSGQQAAPQLPSPHTNQEAPQQPLLSPPKDKEASQQPLPSSPTLKDKEAPQLPSTHTETEVSKDKEASPVQVMPPPPSCTINPPPSSPYDTIHKESKHIIACFYCHNTFCWYDILLCRM